MTSQPSASLDPTRALQKARRAGLFYVEYLAALERLSALPAEQQEAQVWAAFRELFFAWIEPERSCIFLDGQGRCSCYEHRPLTCRLFGLVPVPNLEQAQEELHLAAAEEARRLARRGVEIPRATLTRALAGCRQVRCRHGRRPALDQDELAERVAALDGGLLSREVVIREYCFQSFPDRLGAAVFGEGRIEGLRLRLVRRAQRGEPVEELLARVMKRAEVQSALIHRRRR